MLNAAAEEAICLKENSGTSQFWTLFRQPEVVLIKGGVLISAVVLYRYVARTTDSVLIKGDILVSEMFQIEGFNSKS